MSGNFLSIKILTPQHNLWNDSVLVKIFESKITVKNQQPNLHISSSNEHPKNKITAARLWRNSSTIPLFILMYNLLLYFYSLFSQSILIPIWPFAICTSFTSYFILILIPISSYDVNYFDRLHSSRECAMYIHT